MKNSFKRTILFSGIVILVLVVSSFTTRYVFGKKETKKEMLITSKNGFAILELFTSQGCSSCPPADAVLAKYALQENPNIIPLAFHVDYWNYIGWKDPFSKSQFTDRQRNYVNQLHAQGNYTPQLVINGKYELVGSKENSIENIVKKEITVKNQFQIDIKKSVISEKTLTIEFETNATAANVITNLALVKKKEFTSIKRGENSGLKQTNYNIVFDFKTVKSHSNATNKVSFVFDSEKVASDFIVVAYLQNSTTGAIVGATKSEIN
jgi:hypothetical protein